MNFNSGMLALSLNTIYLDLFLELEAHIPCVHIAIDSILYDKYMYLISYYVSTMQLL